MWKPICSEVWAGCSKLHLQALLQMPANETQDVDFDSNTLYRLDLTRVEIISPFPWQLKSYDSSTNGSSFWTSEVQIQYRIIYENPFCSSYRSFCNWLFFSRFFQVIMMKNSFSVIYELEDKSEVDNLFISKVFFAPFSNQKLFTQQHTLQSVSPILCHSLC